MRATTSLLVNIFGYQPINNPGNKGKPMVISITTMPPWICALIGRFCKQIWTQETEGGLARAPALEQVVECKGSRT